MTVEGQWISFSSPSPVNCTTDINHVHKRSLSCGHVPQELDPPSRATYGAIKSTVIDELVKPYPWYGSPNWAVTLSYLTIVNKCWRSKRNEIIN